MVAIIILMIDNRPVFWSNILIWEVDRMWTFQLNITQNGNMSVKLILYVWMTIDIDIDIDLYRCRYRYMTRVHNHVVNPIIILETLMVYITHFWQNWGWFIYYWIPHSPHSGIMDAYGSPFSYGEVMLSPQSLCTLWQLFTGCHGKWPWKQSANHLETVLFALLC